MRRVVLAAFLAVSGWTLVHLPAVEAGEMPGHWMNPHCPFIIHNCYWHPGGYGIWGPTDIVYPRLQPVNHVGPPPFGPRWWYQRPVMPCGYGGECCENGMCYAPGAQPCPTPPGPGAAPPPPGMQKVPVAPAAPAGHAPEGRWFRSPRDYYMYPIPY